MRVQAGLLIYIPWILLLGIAILGTCRTLQRLNDLVTGLLTGNNKVAKVD